MRTAQVGDIVKINDASFLKDNLNRTYGDSVTSEFWIVTCVTSAKVQRRDGTFLTYCNAHLSGLYNHKDRMIVDANMRTYYCGTEGSLDKPVFRFLSPSESITGHQGPGYSRINANIYSFSKDSK